MPPFSRTHPTSIPSIREVAFILWKKMAVTQKAGLHFILLVIANQNQGGRYENYQRHSIRFLQVKGL